MRTLRLAAMIFALSPLAVATADDKPGAPKGDLARFQGTWKATVGPDKDIVIRLTFKGNATTFILVAPDGNEFTSRGEIKLDEAARPHKTIDWTKFTGPNGDDISENRGIYEIEGDTLRVCSGGPGNERPTEFKAGGEGPPHLVVLTRETSEKKGAAAGTGADSPKGDLARFQGTWKTMVGPDRDVPVTIKIKGNTATASGTTPGGESFELKGEIKLDEAARPHKTIDWTKFIKPGGEEAPENLGIYSIEDADTIKICNGGPGKERPSDFKPGVGEPPSLLVLKREKD